MRVTTFTLLSTFVALAAAGPLSTVQRRGQCAVTLNTAHASALTMKKHYYNGATGAFNDGELWTDANAMEDIFNLVLANSAFGNDFADMPAASTVGRLALASPSDPKAWRNLLQGSNDDAQWIILALWKMGDYYGSVGKDRSAFDTAATTIYNIIAAEWDDTVCGGGVWWNTQHNYKNAITNELFLLTSAECYNRHGTQSCLANAQKTWAWISKSGMRNGDNLYNDGLTSQCKNNGQTTWTYNQGVIASGLAALYKATGSKDTSLLTQAELTLDATIQKLTVNNILKESCDDAKSSKCDPDQNIFKGIWTKHLQFYLDLANDPARVTKYSGFLGSQSSAIIHYGTNANDDIGSVWYAPSQGGSIFKSQSSTSGIAGLVAAAKYGPC